MRRAFAVAALAFASACTATGGAATRATTTTTHVSPSPSTATTSASTNTTTALDVPVLPRPQHSPDDPYAAVPVRQVGTIAIPRIGLVHPVYEGIWLTVIDHGPGHWPGTAMPGRLGNTVFAGHRVTHTHPFRRLDELRPGDAIVFTMANGTFTYAVRRVFVVNPDDSWVVDQHDAREVTLIACHPPHSAAQRIIVRGVLVRAEPKAAP